MSKIVNNKILYPTHCVVCDPKIATMDYMLIMHSSLTDNAVSSVHRRQLFDLHNDGTWTIEDKWGVWKISNNPEEATWTLIPHSTPYKTPLELQQEARARNTCQATKD